MLHKPIDVNALALTLTRWLAPNPSNPPDDSAIDLIGKTLGIEQSFPGINLDDALPRFLGKRDLLARARDAFLLQHIEDPAQLAEFAQQQAWPQMRRIAHSIKGASGNIGASEVNHCIRQLERVLEEPDTAGLSDLIENLVTAFGHMQTATKN